MIKEHMGANRVQSSKEIEFGGGYIQGQKFWHLKIFRFDFACGGRQKATG